MCRSEFLDRPKRINNSKNIAFNCKNNRRTRIIIAQLFFTQIRYSCEQKQTALFDQVALNALGQQAFAIKLIDESLTLQASAARAMALATQDKISKYDAQLREQVGA